MNAEFLYVLRSQLCTVLFQFIHLANFVSVVQITTQFLPRCSDDEIRMEGR